MKLQQEGPVSMKHRNIRNKFTLYYVLLICLSVVLFEALIIGYSGRFFYSQLGEQMKAQMTPLVNTLQKDIRSRELSAVLGSHSDLFSKSTGYEVQVYDKTGELLIYTYGEWNQIKDVKKDVATALRGGEDSWHGVDLDGRKVMTYSCPLMVNGQVEGVIRFVAPLQLIDKQIKRMATYFIGIGLLVILITSVGAYVLADTVTTPILNLIKVTRKMSTGDFSVQAVVEYDDEIGELAEGMNHLSAEIKKRDYLKNRMFSSVSHELRTPLTAIRGWAETLNDPMYTQGKEELEDGLGVIVQESARLQKMVEELLDFSRMMSIEFSYKLEETDLTDLIITTLNALKPKASSRKVALHFTEASKMPLVRVDAHRFKQLLINLVDNALKFTPEEGCVEVMVSSNEDHFYLIVKDTGCGIAEEALPFVKERFYKGNHAGSHLGIGLALCDEIIKAHGGVWDIKSTLGKGTLIEMTFPRV